MAINYEPVSIDSQLSDQAIKYVDNKDAAGDFRVNAVVAEYTGIKELEKLSQQRELEKEALKLSQEVQETAYKEAYNLGKEEGRKEAFDQEKARIDDEIETFRKIIEEIRSIKTGLLKDNEKHIVNLCFYLAKRLLMKEIDENVEYPKTIIKRAIEMAQSDENITIRLSPTDYKFIMRNKEEVLADLNLNQNTKIEEEDMERGGVILETNYGVIDASIEQRLEKLKDLLEGQMKS